MKRVLLLFMAAAACLMAVRVTGRGIPCLFHAVTGLDCPGCGATRMLLALAAFDFRGAFRANPWLLVTGPLLAAELLYTAAAERKRRSLPLWNRAALIVYLGLTVAFGVARNVVRL